MKPLVSILICAYNAERTIAQTLQSAVGQTWPRKEIIVVDDGSKDRTAEVVRQFKEVTLASTENRGFCPAQNYAYQLSHGDYIQYLDADDLLALDKIERQLGALQEGESRRILLSSPWAHFYYRTRNARFVRNPLCEDLSPVEWLLRKLGQNCHMQNATWLVSRELVEAAGPWNNELFYDQDGEFFARVLLASAGTRFVSGTGIYYRISGLNSISFIGQNHRKMDSLLLSVKLHIQYLRSLEDSERVRKACLTYLQKYCWDIYPERPDLVAEFQKLAGQLDGRLETPGLRWKYAWLRKVIGYQAAKNLQLCLPEYKAMLTRAWERSLCYLEAGRLLQATGNSAGESPLSCEKSNER